MCNAHYTKCLIYGVSSKQLIKLYDIKYCQVCGAGGKLHIDHDHACCLKLPACGNCVRGMLCQSCNQALGFLKDNPVRIRALADYIDP